MFKARCCFTLGCRRHGRFLGGRGSFSAEVEQGTFLVKAAEQISQIDGQVRVVIERVTPEIDGGRFPIKRVPNESVEVKADIFADGHDVIGAVLKWRGPQEAWRSSARSEEHTSELQSPYVISYAV